MPGSMIGIGTDFILILNVRGPAFSTKVDRCPDMGITENRIPLPRYEILREEPRKIVKL